MHAAVGQDRGSDVLQRPATGPRSRRPVGVADVAGDQRRRWLLEAAVVFAPDGKGRQSGIEVEMRVYDVFTFRDGKVARHASMATGPKLSKPRTQADRVSLHARYCDRAMSR